jgi:hypothetical protein
MEPRPGVVACCESRPNKSVPRPTRGFPNKPGVGLGRGAAPARPRPCWAACSSSDPRPFWAKCSTIGTTSLETGKTEIFDHHDPSAATALGSTRFDTWS